jgi:hypothetical protein
MSYDKDGHRYDLPVFVINPPNKFLDSGAQSNFKIANINVSAFSLLNDFIVD